MANSSYAENGWTLPEPLAELALEDEALIADLIDTFRTDTAVRLRLMREALNNSDLRGIRREAHTVKGSSRQIGAEALGTICHELELAAIETPVAELAGHVERIEEQFDEVCVAMLLYASRSMSAPTA